MIVKDNLNVVLIQFSITCVTCTTQQHLVPFNISQGPLLLITQRHQGKETELYDVMNSFI